jgi:hypothetical protein
MFLDTIPWWNAFAPAYHCIIVWKPHWGYFNHTIYGIAHLSNFLHLVYYKVFWNDKVYRSILISTLCVIVPLMFMLRQEDEGLCSETYRIDLIKMDRE